jgi:hypothetical protein
MEGTSAPGDERQWPQNRGGRRRSERLYEPFPILIRGMDARGEGFALETVLNHFSACDFYVLLPHRLGPGAKLFAVVRLSLAPAEVPAARVALRGLVLRVDPLPSGLYGTAVRITRHRFLYWP